MNQYLLFDLDGTLTDPKIGITTCVQYALASFGIEEPDLDKLEPFIGPPLKDSFMEFYGMDEAQAEQAIVKYRERFQTVGMFENEVYPGIRRMLAACKRHGATLAVASSKPQVFVEKILKHFGLARYFKVIVGSELDGRRTDKKEVVEEALRQLFPDNDIDYDNIVMIGDRRFDVEGAKDNKAVSVAVAYGYGSMDELWAAKPDYIVTDVAELQELLLRGRIHGREKAVLSWHPPKVMQKVCRILWPLVAYILIADCLRMVVVLTRGELSLFINSILFLFLFAGFYYTVGRTDLIQEKFCFRVRNASEEGCRNRAGWLDIFLMFLLSACLSVGCSFLFSLTGLAGASEDFVEASGRQMQAGLVLGLWLYGICSPLAEELIFRGILFNRMKRYFSPVAAMLLSGAVFGLYHGNPIQAVYGLAAGAVLAAVYHQKGSFAFPVMMHGVMNVCGFLLSFLGIFRTGIYGWPACIGALAVAAGSFFLLLKRH